MFDNSPTEYAMLQGWAIQFENWTKYQKQMYLNWSNSKTRVGEVPNLFAPSEGAATEVPDLFAQSEGAVTEVPDLFAQSEGTVTEVPSKYSVNPGEVEMQEMNPFDVVSRASDVARSPFGVASEPTIIPAAPTVVESVPFNVTTVSDATWTTDFNINLDELPALPDNFGDYDRFRYNGSEYSGRPGSIELQEMGARSAPWAGSVQGSEAPSVARSAPWEGSAQGSVAPSAADPAVEMANLSEGDRYIRGLDPKAPTAPSEYAPSAPGEFRPGSIELQELGSATPSIQPSLPSEVAGNEMASPWEMSGPTKNAGYEIADLQKVRTPGISMAELENSGLSSEQITDVLGDNFEGYNAFGEGSFDIGGLMGSLGGMVFNTAIVNPLLQALSDSGDFGKVVSTGVNIYGAVSMLASADFVGMGIQGMLQLVQAFGNQLHRVEDNDYSADTADTRLMMVRDGNKWYPAILKDRMKGEGLWDKSNNLSVAYGNPEDLRFYYEDGKYRAHFIHQKNKTFRMDDSEWSGEKSTLEYANQKDFMRPFYFLSKDEAVDALKGYGTKDFAWKTKDIDESTFTPFMKKMSDLQNGLDYLQNNERRTGDPTTFLSSDSRGIRRMVVGRLEEGQRAFENDTFQNSRVLPKEDEKFGLGTDWDSYTSITKRGLYSMAELDNNVITRKIATLKTTRQKAASEAGVDWRVYADYDKDLPAAKTAQDLQTQLMAINAYDDRSYTQKQYLQEKAGVRYLMQFSGDMGYGAHLYDITHEQLDQSDLESHMRDLTGLHDQLGHVTQGVQDVKDSEMFKLATAMQGYDYSKKDEYLTTTNIVPLKYAENGKSLLNSIPAWVNKGESPFSLVSDNLAGWQADEENTFQTNYDQMYKTITDDIGYDPTDKIRTNGTHIRTQGIYDEIVKSKQFTKTLPPIPEGEKEGKKEYKPEKQTSSDFMKAAGASKKHDGEYMDILKSISQQNAPDRKEDVAKFDKIIYPSHFLDTNEVITLDSFIDRVNTHDFEFNAIGERSHLHFIESVLHNQIPWIPENYVLDDKIIPHNWIKGNENTYKPLIHQIDNDKTLKGRSEYLHKMVTAPRQDKYTETYHPDDSSFNPKELADDWSLPFKYKQNSVEFNHKIESQMDFDYEETII
jgi:hypothetical protein